MHRQCAALRDDERGAAGIFVVLGMGVILGSAALAIDMGHMMNARTESQRVADLAALAGAAAFIDAPGNPAQTARAWAMQYAAANTVDRAPVSLAAEDIAVDLANERVRVTVRNTAVRGNAIETVFGRALGIDRVDIVTTAVAEASAATAVNCALPLMLPDRWTERGGDPLRYDPGVDYYEAWNPDGSANATFTGYSVASVGDAVAIKANTGPGYAARGEYYPVGAGDLTGGSGYGDHISLCPDEARTFTLDDLISTDANGMVGPTRQGFQDLIDLDRSALWDPAQQCVVDVLGGPCRGSPRIRPIALFDPTDAMNPGVSPARIKNFAGVFVDRIQGNQVLLILAGYSGVQPAGVGGQTMPTLFKVLRLVE